MTHPERSESQLAGSRFVRVAGVALFWLLGGQAEEGGRKGRVGLLEPEARLTFASSASLPAFQHRPVPC